MKAFPLLICTAGGYPEQGVTPTQNLQIWRKFLIPIDCTHDCATCAFTTLGVLNCKANTAYSVTTLPQLETCNGGTLFSRCRLSPKVVHTLKIKCACVRDRDILSAKCTSKVYWNSWTMLIESYQEVEVTPCSKKPCRYTPNIVCSLT